MDVQKQKTEMFFGVVQRQMSRGITFLEETGETALKHVKKVRHERKIYKKVIKNFHM